MSSDKHVTQPSLEAISALMDGELNRCPKTILSISDSASEDDVWARYHLIREVLHAHSPLSIGCGQIAKSVEKALEKEPTLPQNDKWSYYCTQVIAKVKQTLSPEKINELNKK